MWASDGTRKGEPLRTVTRKDVMNMGLDEQKRFLAALKQTMVNPDGVRLRPLLCNWRCESKL